MAGRPTPVEAEIEDAVGGAVAVAGEATLAAITRGEIDVQIATAHQFPRSLARFKAHATEMATMDEETAESCLYKRPVGKEKGVMKFAEGMSIRMAEIVAASYGNIRVGSMIIEMTERYIKARGYAHDLESNYACTSEVMESTVTKDGYPYSERMRVVIAKACLAKARRDATFQVVPKAMARPIEQAVRDLLLGDTGAASMEKRRSNISQWIARLGIDKQRVFDALGVAGLEDIGIAEMETLAGLKTSIKDGEVTVDEAFPAAGADGTPIQQPRRASEKKAEAPAAQPEHAPQQAQQPAQAASDPQPGKTDAEQFAEQAGATMEEMQQVAETLWAGAKLADLTRGQLARIRDEILAATPQGDMVDQAAGKKAKK